jgi:arylformamidase
LSFCAGSSWFELSHQIHPGMQTFPVSWHRPVDFISLGTLEEVGRRTTHVHIGTHSGTHIDAPSHFIRTGSSISDIPLERFSSRAVLLDLRNVAAGHIVDVDELQRTAISSALPGDSILMNFGWSKHYGTERYYPDQPFLSEAAMEYLLGFRPTMIGYDLAMPDNPKHGRGSDCDSPMHKLALGKNVLLLENLKFPSDIPESFELFAFPLNLKDLDGSPVRAVGHVS